MKINRNLAIAAALLVVSTQSFHAVGHAADAASGEAAASPAPISCSSDGKLLYPAHYRQWIYLSTGFDMSYNSNAQPGHHMFNNVFVNPEAWQSFQKTGTWPDKTILVLEVRGGEGKGSIIKGGQYQSSDVMGIEVHVRDDARFKDRWAFFGFDDHMQSELVPRSEDCYACHQTHGAVDNTFVQFYPTLIELAASHKTLSAEYLRQK